MENYELYIEPKTINPVNGQFLKGNIPFNKGLPQKEWMDGRKIKRVNKFLKIGRQLGNKNLPGNNMKQIVGIKDGKLISFSCARTAAEFIKSLGIRINRRNINIVCNGKDKYRKRAGNYQWFFASDIEKYKDLIIC